MNEDCAVIRILLVDDHPAVRQGLSLLLAPEGIDVYGEASNQKEALSFLDESRPDIALVDLSLAGEDGLDLVSCFCDRKIPVLVYSMHEDLRHIENALSSGASGYVSKRELHRVLVEAIREVASGGRFISPNAALVLANRVSNSELLTPSAALSEQEKQVYRLLGEGEGNIEIAASLKISTRTVESYYTRIMDKLSIDGMRELRRHAINHYKEHSGS